MRGILALAGAVMVGIGIGLYSLPAGVATFGAMLYLDVLIVTLLERKLERKKER